jgi:hypothetical protein
LHESFTELRGTNLNETGKEEYPDAKSLCINVMLHPYTEDHSLTVKGED